MSLRLYNTLTRQKEPFEPLDSSNVRMYVCGPTVYDYAHIGNARPAIVFDVLYRLLRHLYPGAGKASDGSRVTYVRNITDIDDKINARALELRGDRKVDVLEVVRELTERTYAVYQEDVAALGNLPPTFMPRATQHVPQMIAMIRSLIDAGLAYEAEGHVLFEVAKKADYGKLSRRPLDEMIAGARVDVAPYKRSPMDFVLWKPSDANTPGWESPWGRGRPGWHLECSSMIEATMGETIDIHGGGIDLVFPHHENEIAQSEGAHGGNGLARVWMHNGFLNVEGEKMSKSLGNFVTIHELLETDRFGGRRWKGDLLRFAMLQTHYLQPIDWTVSGLEQAESRLRRWRQFASERKHSRLHPELYYQALDALYDDLNLPKMMGVIDEVIGNKNSGLSERYTVYKLLRLIGFKGPTSVSTTITKKIMSVERDLGKVDQILWKRIVEKASAPPVDEEGSEAVDLVANTANVDATVSHVSSIIQHAAQVPSVREIEDERTGKLQKIWLARSNAIDTYRKQVIELNKNLASLYKSLSQIKTNEWRVIAENVREKPLLTSGNPKATTNLVANIFLLKQMLSTANDYVLPICRYEHVLERIAQKKTSAVDSEEERIARLMDLRNAARKAKDFKESDRIRDELLAQGIQLKDGPDGTTWEIKR